MKLRSLELACAMIDWKGGPSHPERKAIYVVLDSKPNHSLMFLMVSNKLLVSLIVPFFPFRLEKDSSFKNSAPHGSLTDSEESIY